MVINFFPDSVYSVHCVLNLLDLASFKNMDRKKELIYRKLIRIAVNIYLNEEVPVFDIPKHLSFFFV